jgi:ATP-dependent Clp endopeptidase proteolytic subunit ClpP
MARTIARSSLPLLLAHLVAHSSDAFSLRSSLRARPSCRSSSVEMMPIGVPKVAYRVPGAQFADWVSLYNRLYRERILFLGAQIDDQLANEIIGIMLYLDSEDNTKPINMYINSPGGSVTSGFAMFDTMRHVKSEVSTINVGIAASMGSFLLMGGTKGKRLALPHSRTMIHQPMAGGFRGQASDIKIEAQQILVIRDRLVRYYAELCGQPVEKVVRDLDRDNFLSAAQALEYGLIDRVIERAPPVEAPIETGLG